MKTKNENEARLKSSLTNTYFSIELESWLFLGILKLKEDSNTLD